MITYRGSNTDGSWFEVWQADDGYSVFAKAKQGIEEHELSWSEAIELLASNGLIAI